MPSIKASFLKAMMNFCKNHSWKLNGLYINSLPLKQCSLLKISLPLFVFFYAQGSLTLFLSDLIFQCLDITASLTYLVHFHDGWMDQIFVRTRSNEFLSLQSLALIFNQIWSLDFLYLFFIIFFPLFFLVFYISLWKKSQKCWAFTVPPLPSLPFTTEMDQTPTH